MLVSMRAREGFVCGLVVWAGACFAEPDEGSTADTTTSATTSATDSGGDDPDTTSSAPSTDDSPADSSGTTDGDSTGSGGIPAGANIVYATPGTYDGDFVVQAGGEPGDAVGWADGQCELAGAFAEHGCTFAIAVVEFPMAPIDASLFPNAPFYSAAASRVAPAPGEFVAGPLEASLVAAGVFDPASALFWTGYDNGVADNCGGWTVGLAAGNGIAGNGNDADAGWLGAGAVQSCDTPLPLLCVCWAE